jgi:hypothetical protein
MRDLFIQLICYSLVVMPLPSEFPATDEFNYPSLFKAFRKLRSAVWLLLLNNFSENDIDKAEVDLEETFTIVKTMEEKQHINWHVSLHLCFTPRFFGNLRNYWMFPYERNYKNMKAALTNGRTVAHTLMKQLQRLFKAAQPSGDLSLSELFQREPDVFVEGQGLTQKKFDAQQRKKDKVYKNVVKTIVNHEQKRANAGDFNALDTLYMQVDHPNLYSPSLRIEQNYTTKDACLNWLLSSKSIRPEAYPFETDRRLRANLRYYLSVRVFRDNNTHITIQEVAQVRVCIANGFNCEASRRDEQDHNGSSQSATRSTYTSHVKVFRPANQTINLAEVRLLLNVKICVDEVDPEHRNGCTCHTKPSDVCKYEPPRDPTLNETARKVTLQIAVVDYLKPYAIAHAAFRDLIHPSGLALSSLSTYHEYNRHLGASREENDELQAENDAGDHFISVRRIIEGVTLMKGMMPGKPPFYLVLPHPKGI